MLLNSFYGFGRNGVVRKYKRGLCCDTKAHERNKQNNCIVNDFYQVHRKALRYKSVTKKHPMFSAGVFFIFSKKSNIFQYDNIAIVSRKGVVYVVYAVQN